MSAAQLAAVIGSLVAAVVLLCVLAYAFGYVEEIIRAWRGRRKDKPCIPISCPPVEEQEITFNLCVPIDCAACGQPGDANECYQLTHPSAPGQTFYVHPDCASSPAGRAAIAALSYRLRSP